MLRKSGIAILVALGLMTGAMASAKADDTKSEQDTSTKLTIDYNKLTKEEKAGFCIFNGHIFSTGAYICRASKEGNDGTGFSQICLLGADGHSGTWGATKDESWCNHVTKVW